MRTVSPKKLRLGHAAWIPRRKAEDATKSSSIKRSGSTLLTFPEQPTLPPPPSSCIQQAITYVHTYYIETVTWSSLSSETSIIWTAWGAFPLLCCFISFIDNNVSDKRVPALSLRILCFDRHWEEAALRAALFLLFLTAFWCDYRRSHLLIGGRRRRQLHNSLPTRIVVTRRFPFTQCRTSSKRSRSRTSSSLAFRYKGFILLLHFV